mmetsp:Transcript_4026/g.10027  ORF Transcript_4026/g.10027 Transcript_4026/m.10027 type:complete len:201 (+) Transcript_4026:678-1280(+)
MAACRTHGACPMLTAWAWTMLPACRMPAWARAAHRPVPAPGSSLLCQPQMLLLTSQQQSRQNSLRQPAKLAMVAIQPGAVGMWPRLTPQPTPMVMGTPGAVLSAQQQLTQPLSLMQRCLLLCLRTQLARQPRRCRARARSCWAPSRASCPTRPPSSCPATCTPSSRTTRPAAATWTLTASCTPAAPRSWTAPCPGSCLTS